MESSEALDVEIINDDSTKNHKITCNDDLQVHSDSTLVAEEFGNFSIGIGADSSEIGNLSIPLNSPTTKNSQGEKCISLIKTNLVISKNEDSAYKENSFNCSLQDESGSICHLNEKKNVVKLESSEKMRNNEDLSEPIRKGIKSCLADSRSHLSYMDCPRAAAMRVKIEEKLAKVECEINSQVETSLKNEDDIGDSDSLTEALECIESVQAKRSRSCSMIEMKATAIFRLQSELDKAQKELKLKDEEVSKLTKIRDEVGVEIEDLTASLFEEANNMVREANIKQALAEKHSKEANMKLNMLQEEVKALKALIQEDGSHIPSYLIPSSECSENGQSNNKKNTFKRTSASYYKSPSINNFQNQGKSELSSSENISPPEFHREQYEADPVPHREFVAWRQNPQIDKNHPFLQRIYLEDINPCMNFENKLLASKALAAVEEDRIIIENISSKGPLPKKCDLLEAPRFCRYKMNLGDGEEWHYISSLGRNRITAICDFFCYLRYIEKGLIKHSIHEVFLEILKRRKRITLARLGLLEDEHI